MTLSQGERIVLAAGALLAVDLLLLPWHSVDLTGLNIAADPTRTGVQSPNAAYGVVALALALAMIAQIAAGRLAAARLPDLPVPWGQLQLVAGVFVAVVLVVKLVRETAYLGYGAYSGVLAGILVAYGGYAIAQEDARAA